MLSLHTRLGERQRASSTSCFHTEHGWTCCCNGFGCSKPGHITALGFPPSPWASTRASAGQIVWMKDGREGWSSESLVPGIQCKLQAIEIKKKTHKLKAAPILALDHQVQVARSSPSSWLCCSGSRRISLNGLQHEFKKS